MADVAVQKAASWRPAARWEEARACARRVDADEARTRSAAARARARGARGRGGRRDEGADVAAGFAVQSAVRARAARAAASAASQSPSSRSTSGAESSSWPGARRRGTRERARRGWPETRARDRNGARRRRGRTGRDTSGVRGETSPPTPSPRTGRARPARDGAALGTVAIESTTSRPEGANRGTIRDSRPSTRRVPSRRVPHRPPRAVVARRASAILARGGDPHPAISERATLVSSTSERARLHEASTRVQSQDIDARASDVFPRTPPSRLAAAGSARAVRFGSVLPVLPPLPVRLGSASRASPSTRGE